MTRYVLEIEFECPPLGQKRQLALLRSASDWADVCLDEPRSARIAEMKLPVERARETKPMVIGEQGVLGRDYVDL